MEREKSSVTVGLFAGEVAEPREQAYLRGAEPGSLGEDEKGDDLESGEGHSLLFNLWCLTGSAHLILLMGPAGAPAAAVSQKCFLFPGLIESHL